MRARPLLTRLLVTLLLLQWGSAFAHCLHPTDTALHATICTAAGPVDVALDPDGNPARRETGKAMLCPLCLAPAPAALPLPPALPLPRLQLVLATETPPLPPREAPAPPPRGCQPRAPPATS